MNLTDLGESQSIKGLIHKKIVGQATENMLIHGDNLSVLEKIKDRYVGKIKCIYIDPPYNTCNEFEHFEDDLSHEEWINTLKPRLLLLWEFLKEDGTIWISIDDSECHYLKVLCDELWGRENFLTMIVRQKNDYPRNFKRRKIVHMQDYVLIYSKNVDNCCINEIPLKYLKNYFIDEEKREWIPDSILEKYNPVDENKFVYRITTPSGRILEPPQGRQWTLSEDEFKKLKNTNQLWFGTLEDEYPCRKKYKDEMNGSYPISLWTKDMVGSNQEARTEVCAFNKHEFFYVPKPEKFLQLILSIATNEGDWVLDAYLGSGTTAAVAMKMKRKWIGIEKGSQCEDFCLPRLESVVSGELNGISKSVDWNGGSGFSYFMDEN